MTDDDFKGLKATVEALSKLSDAHQIRLRALTAILKANPHVADTDRKAAHSSAHDGSPTDPFETPEKVIAEIDRILEQVALNRRAVGGDSLDQIES